MIVANMATFPARADQIESAVRRLAPQVDRLNLVLNEYDEIPSWCGAIPNLDARIPDRDRKDINKFWPCVDADDIVFLVDDDLTYPKDYVAHTMAEISRSKRDPATTIFGYHGTTYGVTPFTQKIKNVLRGRFGRNRAKYAKTGLMYASALAHPTAVDQLGTGTVALRGAIIPAMTDLEGGERRADVRLARLANERGITMIALPRSEGWIPYSTNDASSIYNTYTLTMPPELADEISSFAGCSRRRGNAA